MTKEQVDQPTTRTFLKDIEHYALLLETFRGSYKMKMKILKNVMKAEDMKVYVVLNSFFRAQFATD
jgi:hypothetical protein